MAGFAVDNYSVVLTADLGAAVPDFFDKGTGGVVLFRCDADFTQLCFDLEGSSEGGDDDNIVGSQGVEGDELSSMGVLEKPDAQGPEVSINLRVMDHFAQEEDAAAGVFAGRAEGDLDGVLYSVAESEVACEVDSNGPQVERRRRKVFLHFVFLSAPVLDGGDESAAVSYGDIKIFHIES